MGYRSDSIAISRDMGPLSAKRRVLGHNDYKLIACTINFCKCVFGDHVGLGAPDLGSAKGVTLICSDFRKSLMSVISLPAILGPEMAASI